MPETWLFAAVPGALTEEITARVFLSIAIIIVVARVFGRLAQKVRQPAVVGEIVAGIMLGPSFLGLINEDLPTKLFPLEVRPFLGIIAQVGLIIFMFIVGLELDMGLIRGKGRLAAVTSLTSVVLPFTFGLAISGVLHEAYGVVNGEEVEWLHFALFMGAAMSVTAFPVLARILNERGMHRTRIGVLTLACAAVDDILAWSLLAGVLAVVGEGHLAPQWVIILTLVYGAVMVVLIRPLLQKVVDRYQEVGRLTPDSSPSSWSACWSRPTITSEIGIHAIFGAFFFGAVFPREGAHQMFHEILERLEQITVLLLLPVFFVVTGLNVDITGLGVDGLGYLLLVILAACAGKFLGASLASRSQGVPARQALALGVLMNTRGLTELVILTIGREVGVLNDAMFTIMVVMAVFTTIITEPLLRILYPDELVAAGDRGGGAHRLGRGRGVPRARRHARRGTRGRRWPRWRPSSPSGEDPREVRPRPVRRARRHPRGRRWHRGHGHLPGRPPPPRDRGRGVRRPRVRPVPHRRGPGAPARPAGRRERGRHDPGPGGSHLHPAGRQSEPGRRHRPLVAQRRHVDRG